MAEFDLQKGIESTLVIFQHKIKDKSIKLNLNFDKDLPKIEGDRDKLKQHIRVAVHPHLQTRPPLMTHWLHCRSYVRLAAVSSTQQHLGIIFEQDQSPADDSQTQGDKNRCRGRILGTS